MKKVSIILGVLLLFSISMNAQSGTFDACEDQWKIVQQFEQKGLPKSALTEVEKIYKKAKKTNNHPQLIKALLYQSKFALTLEENAQLNIVKELKKEISANQFPTKNILESILADLYWQYFQQNRWRFYNRTNTAEKVDSTDFRTWDLQTIFEETHLHYQKSLENALESQQINVDQFNEILKVEDGSNHYRPKLYDFLAHRAINFYKTEERNLNRPAYKFEMNNPGLLDKNDAFILTIQLDNPKDSLSQQLHALRIYKNLTLFHSRDTDPSALIHLTLDRLNFVKNNAVFDNKEAVYLATLKKLQAIYKNSEASAEVSFAIAQFIYNQSENFIPQKSEDLKWKKVEALNICEEVVSRFSPTSKSVRQCQNLKTLILLPEVNVTSEKFIPINTTSKLLVTHKNNEQLYFKAFKITRKQQEKLRQIKRKSGTKGEITYLNELDEIKNWEAALKNEKDYQKHTTEIAQPALEQGYYLILASNTREIGKKNNDGPRPTFSYTFIQVTDIALVQNSVRNKHVYQVVNRNNGNPILGATVVIKNDRVGRYNKAIRKTLTTNSKGFIEFTTSDRHNNVTATVTNKKDKAILGEYYLNRNYGSSANNRTNLRAFLFTDRSIYRPGQTVYFKGIAVAMSNNKSTSLENKGVAITLKDVNYQNIKTLQLKTNEFGSFSGEFIIPNTGLTGNFSIYATGTEDTSLNGNLNFSVEEYKRPKFETAFKPVTESFKLDDSITVKGFAKAFAGSNITDAKVTYRVTRTAQYPRWYWYSRPSFSSESQEIVYGETTTDAAGNFEVVFKAIPDSKVKKETQPTFSYRVTADVTDINGETRSTQTTVNVGYHTLAISLSIADKIDKLKKDHMINLTTSNLNGEFTPTKGILKIFKLKAPDHVLRIRPWEAPDYQNYSKDEFKKLFPHEAYNNEDKWLNWEKGKMVFTKDFDTKKSSEIPLKNIKKWLSGNYIAIMTCTDKFGQEVKDEIRFSAFSIEDKTVADNKAIFFKIDKSDYKPGEYVNLKVGSAAKDISITIAIEKKGNIVDTKIIQLSNTIKTIRIPVTKDDWGGFAFHYQTVLYNAFVSGTENIRVPYPKHELAIETTTFRDKLKPGQNEMWSFKLKGSKGDQKTAEILASMYDASLDEFRPHQWGFNPIRYQYYYAYNRSNASHSFGNTSLGLYFYRSTSSVRSQYYDQLNYFGLRFGYQSYRSKSLYSIEAAEESELQEIVVTGEVKDSNEGLTRKIRPAGAPNELDDKKDGDFSPKNSADKFGDTDSQKQPLDGIVARKNLQETAFFYPHLKTDKDGNVSFNFTVPESLTKWKLQLLAHTKDMASTTKQLTTVTQKELMVLPNPPRFLREGDQITFASKIANLTDNSLNGVSELQLFDALTNKSIDTKLGNADNRKNFTIDAKGNANVSWTLQIPDDVQAVKYRIVAKAADFTDGEENALPVLSNRMLVTETLPMWLRSNQTKTFSLDKLKNNTSTTLKNHKLTLEVTSNPAWYAVQALPYLMEYPYECAEQTFSRYYANALASHIANSNPRIQDVFNQWASTEALLSNLEKNQELKSMIIQETPWLRDAQSETEQKKRIALLFDLNKMQNELQSAARKLSQMQMGNGGFPWFKGSRYPNRYITQHIASGFGHLKKLNVISTERGTNDEKSVNQMLNKAVKFLDDEILEDYRKLEREAKRIRERAKTKAKGIKDEKAFWKRNHTGHFQIQYLYMRSFYKDMSIPVKAKEAVDYYTDQAYKFWLSNGLYTKGMIALIAHRNNNIKISKKIIASLKENSIDSEELGMYWKSNTASWYWYQAPIETQALLIEAFTEIDGDIKTIDALKVWLLKNKQTNRWKTTKATTEAVYALLLQGSDWLEVTDFVDITIGDTVIDPLQLEDTKVEAGTGYFKTAWTGNEITQKMADVKLSKKSEGIAWGALYWQYFEDLDKITSAETPLQLKKKLFVKRNTDKGEELSEIKSTTDLKLGDLVKVRIELKVDRAMEFVHMKDMRAAGFEPVNVLSSYKWQDGLGYYESTKDAATNFFFDYLSKGVYVFEYDLRVNNKGDFSNGITTIQSMYAPEFSSHSEGVRVKVK